MSTITLSTACTKYNIERKKLMGFCFRNAFEDPIVIEQTDDGELILLEDWRLQGLAARLAKVH